MTRVSLVVPVHAGIAPNHWRAALESVRAQTRPADEVVVVEDGPLTDDHHAALADVGAELPLVRVVLPRNRGAGVANQAGLEAATGEWIAKADADDVSLPQRIGTQVEAAERLGVDLLGAAMWEFDIEPEHPQRLRANPPDHVAIARRMRLNNPINHSTAFYRREVALAAGGYPRLRLMQDYDLFARMLVAGARMANLPEPLVLFRAGDGMRRRRATTGFLRREVDLQRRLLSYGVVGRAGATRNLVVRGGFRLLPQPALRLTYDRVLSRRLEPRALGGRPS
ncbi:glycosyltransferase [Nocardioides sp. SYSU D00038]|uniref:glycosyltransferase n=1 Tax=Nocardioides sp. SYSU D00038 TaxID=2812554 RepID=UPI001966FCE5|nr:glycosyltransferase [Nocardioides sp. SYSU D00038]